MGKRPLPHEVEAYLQQQIAEIDTKIAALEAEQRVLRRLLANEQAKRSATARGALRKNALQRVLVETAIMDTLKGRGKPVPQADLMTAARVAAPDLKPVTLRSYLFRLKEKGLILSRSPGSQWLLAEMPET